jgi:S1-C subfamily serine protease
MRSMMLLAMLSCTTACTYEQHVHVHPPSAPSSPAMAYREEPRHPLQDPLDAVVRIASINGECTGTVVGDRLVITASACFDRITSAKTFAKDRVRARVGGGFVAWRTVPVMAVLSAPCTGVAVMVTDEVIPDATPLRLRLGAEVAIGEPVRVVGFGRCSGVSVGARAVSPLGRVHDLGDAFFSTNVHACSGDAGGPLISEWTGEVVGVLQGEPVTADKNEPTSTVGGSVARVDVARGLLAQAFLVAHGVEPEHLPPISCQ